MSTDFPLDELFLLFARVKGMMLTEGAATRAVELLARAAKETIPAVLGVGITVAEDGGLRSTGSTDSVVSKLDTLQYNIGEGPCLTAVSTARTIRIDDITAEDRWPQWASAASEFPVRSTLSMPLIYAGRTIGAIKVYSPDIRGLSQETESSLARFAVPAAALLATAQIPEAPARVSAALKEGLKRRDTIGFAKGILMERHRIGPDAALAEMLETCRQQRLTLHRTAEEIITDAQKTGTGGIRDDHGL